MQKTGARELKTTNNLMASSTPLSSLPQVSDTGWESMALILNGSTERWEEGTQ